ncbi:MAG: hypothetical protein Kow0031_36210 [Anaerolineae bacterium]
MASSTLGQLLRYHRKQAELTQAQLAEMLGYNHSMISHFERDRRLPPRDFLEAFVTLERLDLTSTDTQELWASFLQVLARQPKPTVEPQAIASLLEASRAEKKNLTQLTWADWQQLCQNISRQRMATGRHRFFPQLYLPREPVRQTFADFLQSNRRCLVLVGRSGVGKSNFLLATADHLRQTRPDWAALLYNGAALPVETPLADVITGDFAAQVQDESLSAAQLWAAFGQTAGSKRGLLVAVDALNEHPQPARLLLRLEKFARQVAAGVKLVWSCQPETWRQLRRQVGLTDALYFQDPADGGSHLTLAPFSAEELPAVYANYRRVFHLQSDFNRLTPPVQAALRDPLLLLLVASIYHDRPLPATLSTPTLVAEYARALVRTGRLEAGDLDWLNHTLLPLMLNPPQPDNGVLLSYLAPGGNESLSPAVTRLLNTEILVQEGAGPQQKITFKYERFFDHFAGQRLRELAAAAADPPAVYSRFLGHLPGRLFLWGPLQTALLAELRDGRPALVEHLAGQSLPLKEELLADSLLLFSREDAAQTAAIVERLAGHPQPVVRKTVLAVAGRLQAEAVLLAAGADSHAGVRWAAAYAAYLLWQEQPAAGWRILSAWTTAAGWQRRWPPLGQTLEVCLVTSALILTDPQSAADHPEQRRRLQSLWQPLLANLLLAAPAGDSPPRRIARQGIFRLISGHFQSWVGRSSVGQMLGSFFPLARRQRASYLRLVGCFDASYEELLRQEDVLAEVLHWNELAATDIIAVLLAVKLPRTGHQGLPFVQRLFRRALMPEQPIISPGTLVTAIYLLVNRQPAPPSDEAMVLYRAMARELFDRSWGLYVTPAGETQCHFGLDLFSAVDWRCRGTTQPDLLIYALEKTITEQPPQASLILAGLLRDTLQLVYLVHQPHLALAAVRVVLAHGPIWQDDEQVQAALVSCLAGIGRYAPHGVERLLDEHHVPAGLRYRVQARQATDDVWRQVMVPRLSLFLGDVLPRPGVIDSWVKLLRALPNCPTPNHWLDLVLRETINLIYGQALV